VGGLAIASRIAAHHHQHQQSPVIINRTTNPSLTLPIRETLLEKNEQTGGRCGSFDVTIPHSSRGGSNKNDTTIEPELMFRHVRGPSFMLLPHM
jgi:hypothetical protein